MAKKEKEAVESTAEEPRVLEITPEDKIKIKKKPSMQKEMHDNEPIKVDEDGLGLELAEKKPISNLALIGLHYWKHGKDFVVSAEELISRGNKSGNEYYIAPTYNILIENSKKKYKGFPYKLNPDQISRDFSFKFEGDFNFLVNFS